MTIKKNKKADIKYGKQDILTDKDFDPKNVRHRISIVIPENILGGLRNEAQKMDIGYQTLINQILKNHVFEEKTLEERVARLELLMKQA